tara:strand:- start:3415 stop:5361 length:1947 start_codon:yes stop_codon:yes gene_type:complete
MALVIKDRVKETTTTTGTGAVSLGGAATNFVAFSSVLSDGDTTYYAIVDSNNSDFEVGLGTYASSGNTIARTTVLASSNSNNAVNLSAGTKAIFCAYPADKAVIEDANGVVSIENLQFDTNAIKSTNSNGNIQLFPEGTGFTELYGNTNAGKIRFNCESNSHGVTLQGPPHSAAATYTLELPDADGSSGQLLKTDGSGKLAFTSDLPGVTSTAAELNLLDGSVANTVVNSKAVIYGSGGEVAATSYTGDGSALTGISAGVGALTDGSAVVTAGDSIQPTSPSQAWNYDTLVSTDSGDEWVSVDGSVTPAVNEDTARYARGFGGVIWSDYWKRYFATVFPPGSGTSSISADNMEIVQSLDGVNWSDVGLIRTLTGLGTSGNDGITSDWLQGSRYRPSICVDDSNGRIWCAGEGRTSPYPLVLGYFDPATGSNGVTQGPTPSSANQNSKIIDWRWVKGLNKIIIIYSNRNEYFSTASISAGGTSASSVQTNISSGNDEMEIGFFHTQTAANTHKFYLQNDTSTFWYREGSDFGSLSSGTSAESGWNPSNGGDMSNDYLIKANGGSIKYIRTDNDDWKTSSSSWTTVAMPSNTDISYISYDPVQDDWIGAGQKGFILRSTNGTTWAIAGRCGTWAASRSTIARRTTGAYSY